MRLPRSKKFDAEIDVESVLTNLTRVQTVEKTNLIGKAPRANLDALTKQASERLAAPVASITLIDAQRQFFINTFGATGPLAKAKEASLEYSYCKYVVAYNDVLVVEDVTIDPLVRDVSQAVKHGLRSYLGVPLRLESQPIGSFCVFDNKPRQWSMDDLNGLEEIAHEVMLHIDDQLEDEQGVG